MEACVVAGVPGGDGGAKQPERWRSGNRRVAIVLDDEWSDLEADMNFLQKPKKLGEHEWVRGNSLGQLGAGDGRENSGL